MNADGKSKLKYHEDKTQVTVLKKNMATIDENIGLNT